MKQFYLRKESVRLRAGLDFILINGLGGISEKNAFIADTKRTKGGNNELSNDCFRTLAQKAQYNIT